MTVLLGGLCSININYDRPDYGVFTHQKDTLSNDYFVNLLDLDTTWKSTTGTQNEFVGKDRKSGATKWSATRADLIFGSNSELRGIAELYACDDAKEKMVHDFVAE